MNIHFKVNLTHLPRTLTIKHTDKEYMPRNVNNLFTQQIIKHTKQMANLQ